MISMISMILIGQWSRVFVDILPMFLVTHAACMEFGGNFPINLDVPRFLGPWLQGGRVTLGR